MGLAEARLTLRQEGNAAADDLHQAAWLAGQHSARAAMYLDHERADAAREQEAFKRGLARGHAEAVRHGWNLACRFWRVPIYESTIGGDGSFLVPTRAWVHAASTASAAAAGDLPRTAAGHPHSLWDEVPHQ